MKPHVPRVADSAIFEGNGLTFRADSCKPVVDAVKRGEVRMSALVHGHYPGNRMPPKVLSEVASVGFWDAIGMQTWGLDWHRNEGIEITYLARGKTDFLVEGYKCELQSGQFTVTRPWQRHRLGNPNVGASRLHWVILDVGVRHPNETWRWPDWMVLSSADIKHLTLLLSQNEQPVWQSSDEIGACFERMTNLVQSKDIASIQSRMQILINELFIGILELLQKKTIALDPRLISTKRTVEIFLKSLTENLDHLWTLSEMAEKCGLGRSRFADYCEQITNMSPTDYLNFCRIELAKKLLSSPQTIGVTDIAFTCGFQSSQYFATAFRRRTGCSPREFRQLAGLSPDVTGTGDIKRLNSNNGRGGSDEQCRRGTTTVNVSGAGSGPANAFGKLH